MDQEQLEIIKSDFNRYYLDNKPMAILLFGSKALGVNTKRSDTDICIVLGKKRLGSDELAQEISNVWRVVEKEYDVWLFEELPIYMQARVIDHHVSIYCESYPELSEYFYFYRKLVDDYHYRVKMA